jgi:hypothetical protein
VLDNKVFAIEATRLPSALHSADSFSLTTALPSSPATWLAP